MFRQLNTGGVRVICDRCLAYCTGVVLNNAVRESATPDSKENTDAGNRRFRTHYFLCGALLCNFSSTEHEGLTTHICPTGMFSGTFYAQHFVTKNLHISPRFSPTIFYQDANSVLLLAHFCTAVLLGSIRKTPCLKLFMMRAWRSIYLICITGMFSRTLYA